MEMEYFLRIIFSIVSGATIGFERELKGKPAGLLTLTLVSLGATMIAILQVIIYPEGDITRLSAQVISGVGFIGGGAIIHNKGSVEGLTTAALLWINACLGLIIGYGMLKLAMFSFLCIVVILIVMKRLEEKFIYNRKKIRVLMKIKQTKDFLKIKKDIYNLDIPSKILKFEWNNYEHRLIECIFSVDKNTSLSFIEREISQIEEIQEIYFI